MKIGIKVVEIALEKSELSSRELAWHITDNYRYYISESSVYRILKVNGLITTPAFRIMSAADSFYDKTTAINQMWQTDFTLPFTPRDSYNALYP